MAGKKRRAGKPAPKRAPAFEAGEKTLNLEVASAAVNLNASGSGTYTLAWFGQGVPAHVRAIGQRRKVTLVTTGALLVHGVFQGQTRTFSLKEDDDTVVINFVGTPSATVVFSIGSTLYYKDQ
jgi:hypothetical protein